jgi:anti-sigma factor RsiW
MKCEQYEARLALYVEGDLTPSMTRDVEAHLQTCSTCRGFLEALRESQSMVKSLAGEALDASSFTTVRDRIMEQVSRQPAGRSWSVAASELWHWRRLWAAGVLLAVVVIFLTQWWLLRRPANSRQSGDTASTSERTSQPQPLPPVVAGETEIDAERARRPQPADIATKLPVPRKPKHPVPQLPSVVEPSSSTTDADLEVQTSQELEQGAVLEAEIPAPVDVPPDEPSPLVVKLVTDDPNIVIIWLIDQSVDRGEEPK